MTGDSAITQQLKQPDAVHLDSAFERVAGGPLLMLDQGIAVVLDTGAKEDFDGIEPPSIKLATEFGTAATQQVAANFDETAQTLQKQFATMELA